MEARGCALMRKDRQWCKWVCSSEAGYVVWSSGYRVVRVSRGIYSEIQMLGMFGNKGV